MIENGIEWPDEVPVLRASDICRGEFEDDSGDRHCLIGWRREVFGEITNFRTANAPLLANAELSRACGDEHPITFNDDRFNTKFEIARAWNRAMAKIGYVVGNPEAKSA